MQIKVNGKFYEYFNDASIATSLDAVASTFAFSGKYDPTNEVHRYLFKPLSYHKVEFFDETRLGERNKGLLSTGTVTNHSFNSAAAPNLTVLAGYSLPGVVEDCQIPFALYKKVGDTEIQTVSLESIGLTLEQIIRKILKPFGLNVIVYDSVKKEAAQVIPKSVCSVEQTIKDYICKLANQKNVVVSHDIFGNLILFRPDIKAAPKLFLNQENTLTMSLNIDGQNIHSHITTVRQPTKNTDNSNPYASTNNAKSLSGDSDTADKTLKISSMDTVTNPLVGTFRPMIDILSSGTFYDTHRAAQNKRAAELKNIKIPFTLNYWPTVSVGDVIEVQNPEIFINNKVKMILESSVISENAESKTMSGVLVMPETFTGETPVNIFL